LNAVEQKQRERDEGFHRWESLVGEGMPLSYQNPTPTMKTFVLLGS
jgi:hypothetical protein